MAPFERSEIKWRSDSEKDRIREIREMAEAVGLNISEEEARRQYEGMLGCEVWVNDKYQVFVRRFEGFAVHLSIKTHDRQPARDWREFQQIKNELIGPECEAVELYPAESRRVDTANQYHLWGSSDPAFRFPFGFPERLVSETETHGAKQRPLEDRA
jgi:hypothetical protein